MLNPLFIGHPQLIGHLPDNWTFFRNICHFLQKPLLNAPTDHTEIQLSSINNDILIRRVGVAESHKFIFSKSNPRYTDWNVRENDRSILAQYWEFDLYFFFVRTIFHRWLIHWLMSNCDTNWHHVTPRGVTTWPANNWN